ncbi:MAG: pyridoxal-phosphate dependent enzyme [Conexibacter sp.]
MTALPQAIAEAQSRLRGFAVRTPLIPSPALSAMTGLDVLIKPESLQPSGSFKVRGATNKLLRLDEAQRSRGVVTFSTGNHGCAVAWAARRLGSRAAVYVSELVPPEKLDALRELGAELVVAGASQNEAEEQAHARCAADGMALVHPFDDLDVIAGQGTIGAEIVVDCPAVDTVLVPVGGGGLSSGIAAADKHAKPAARVVGLTIEHGSAMLDSQRAGRPVEVVEAATLADSLGGGIGLDNAHSFRLVRELVDELVPLGEDEIARGMVLGLLHAGLVLEGAGAAGLAALAAGKVRADGPVVVVLTGRRIALQRLLELVAGFEAAPHGR